VPQRDVVEITHLESRITFRFYFDRSGSGQLHITERWGVDAETAIGAFFDPAAGEPVWVDWRRCWETRGPRYTLAWVWLEERTHVMVITCVDKERITS
jgi:hypothetical protein